MKKELLLLLLFLAGIKFSTYATHFAGTELTYKALAPNTYEVTFKLYRECNSTAFPTSMGITVAAPGCNTGRNITLNLASQQIRSVKGPAALGGCNAGYEGILSLGTYTGTLTFAAAEQSCTDWVLSWSTCCRTDIANLNNASTSSIYTEAHLKLLPNLVNSSPQFDTINFNAPPAGYNQKILVSALAQDADGDSLVYSSVAPLTSANQPLTYGPLPGNGAGHFINPNPQPPFDTINNPQIAVMPALGTNYSPSFPLFSIIVDWVVGQQVVNAQPFFELNPHTGNIAFQPAYYITTSGPPSQMGQNRYVLTIQVDEYRKINGVPTKIGSVRRETYIDVIDGAGNANPYLSQVEMNATAIAEGDLIELRPGVTMNLKLTATDQDSTSTVLMTSNVSSILPGAVFSQNGLNLPAGSVTWTATASDVRDQPYYFNVVLKDNVSPMRGYHERTIGVRVRQNGNVTGIKKAFAANANFTAYPNPFTDKISFKFNQQVKAESIIIYNVLGRQVDQIEISKTASGEQHLQWENAGKHAAGIYVAKLVSADKTVQTLKFTKL
ncbi:T9SS type A sorting domain-containing protein [Adhaeribacter sp. BT258]|uniref:T9SS type A sorting domain-containing protein n=1 Tax=Adhaeribacter terrigena TaxID=2793070 RepID=A0ABS1C3L4_9BACT|nr:T9SS type A sorting domain-containing protein [Adhaeribacter terrigena]MBK0403984.1 T9SS type A sorting domain-containing protein [Adhaeribacter terrigena]